MYNVYLLYQIKFYIMSYYVILSDLFFYFIYICI